MVHIKKKKKKPLKNKGLFCPGISLQSLLFAYSRVFLPSCSSFFRWELLPSYRICSPEKDLKLSQLLICCAHLIFPVVHFPHCLIIIYFIVRSPLSHYENLEGKDQASFIFVMPTLGMVLIDNVQSINAC